MLGVLPIGLSVKVRYTKSVTGYRTPKRSATQITEDNHVNCTERELHLR